MPISKLSAILRRLMFEKSIKTIELARATRLPQPTLQRIVAGTTCNPHFSSLVPIADYFGITVSQLKGEESIPWLETHPVKTVAKLEGLIQIPIISWENVIHWPEIKNNYRIDSKQSLWVEEAVGADNFALVLSDTSMYPTFPKDTTIIINPVKIPKDRDYVVVYYEDHSETVFRQFLIDGKRRYIKSHSPDLEQFAVTELKPDDTICGVLVQARKDFGE